MRHTCTWKSSTARFHRKCCDSRAWSSWSLSEKQWYCQIWDKSGTQHTAFAICPTSTSSLWENYRKEYSSTLQGIEKKCRGDTTVRHRHNDTILGASTVNINNSKAMTERKSTKPNPLVIRGKKYAKWFGSFLNFQTTGKRNRRTKSYYGFENSVFSVSESDTISAPKRLRTKKLQQLLKYIQLRRKSLDSNLL